MTGGRTMHGRWQDWINLVLGVWLFVSPWVLGHMLIEAAAWNAFVFGAVIALIAITALARYTVWQEVILIAIALWLIIAPWVLPFTPADADGAALSTALLLAVWNHIAVGLLVAIFAAWEMAAARRASTA